MFSENVSLHLEKMMDEIRSHSFLSIRWQRGLIQVRSKYGAPTPLCQNVVATTRTCLPFEKPFQACQRNGWSINQSHPQACQRNGWSINQTSRCISPPRRSKHEARKGCTIAPKIRSQIPVFARVGLRVGKHLQIYGCVNTDPMLNVLKYSLTSIHVCQSTEIEVLNEIKTFKRYTIEVDTCLIPESSEVLREKPLKLKPVYFQNPLKKTSNELHQSSQDCCSTIWVLKLQHVDVCKKTLNLDRSPLAAAASSTRHCLSQVM